MKAEISQLNGTDAETSEAAEPMDWVSWLLTIDQGLAHHLCSSCMDAACSTARE